MKTPCNKCGVAFGIGEWPFCPHGKGTQEVVSDSIRGGMVMENALPGHKVYSISELKRTLAQHGWKLTESRANVPGKDPHMSRWI